MDERERARPVAQVVDGELRGIRGMCSRGHITTTPWACAWCSTLAIELRPERHDLGDIGPTGRMECRRCGVVPHGSKRERVVALGEIRRLVPAVEVSTR